MAQPFPPADVEAHIEGEISGQVAVGIGNLQIGSMHGGVVYQVAPAQRVRPRPRPTPISLRPPPFPGLLDRTSEIDTAAAALGAGLPVEFHGPGGIGKTVLLRHLAHRSPSVLPPDGVVYLSARQPLADLLQSLYEAFYVSDVPFKPTETQIRHALQERRALVILDDLELARDEVGALMGAAPGCVFLLASAARRLWGEGRAVALHGLPPDDGLALVERELGRPLSPQERSVAQALCATLEGHPLRLLQAAALVREERLTLAEVAGRMQAPAPAEALTAQTLGSLSEPERRVVAALAALGGAPVHTEHVAALASLPDAMPILESLLQLGLVQAHSPRYTLAGALESDLPQAWDLTAWAERALAHFTAWAETYRAAPDRLLEEADAILRLMEWGGAARRWADVLRLAWAVEGALALGRRWAAWAQVLRWALQAAQALEAAGGRGLGTASARNAGPVPGGRRHSSHLPGPGPTPARLIGRSRWGNGDAPQPEPPRGGTSSAPATPQASREARGSRTAGRRCSASGQGARRSRGGPVRGGGWIGSLGYLAST